jgi:hypothetical protein
MLGPAPILDFDGTIAVLAVDWAELRRRLDVRSLDDLWVRDGADWDVVTRAEVGAAATAEPVAATVRSLDTVTAFTVLTNNSEVAVREFLRRFDELGSRLAGVVGRETLGGSKRSPERFRLGFERCVALTATARAGGPVVYVGDARYELKLAADLGARALDVGEIGVRVS